MEEAFVTVYVMNYNEAKTIIETLDSIYGQTYQNLDLLIHDDASTDNSLVVINRWITGHSDRFRHIEIVKNKENRGINYTFDKCVKGCKTEWLKVIAADDILFPTCIEKNITFVNDHNINSLLYSQDLCFTDDIKHSHRRGIYEQKYMEKLGKLTPEKQFKCLLRREIMYAPTTFINTNTYRRVGGISTKVRNIEDSPLALSFTSSGYPINFMDEDTAYYRLGDSVSRSKGRMYNTYHIDQVNLLRKELIYPYIPWYDFFFWYDEAVIRIRYKIIIDCLGNKDTKSNRLANYALMGLSLSSWKKFMLKAFYSLKYQGKRGN